MSETEALGLAIVVWLGAWIGATLALPLVPPWSVGAGLAVAAAFADRPRLLVLAGLLVAVSLGARADAGFLPSPTGRFEGTVRLLTDPAPFGIGTQTEVRLEDGRRLRLTLAPPLSWESERWHAGWPIDVAGRIAALEETPWGRSRHLVGALTAESAEPSGGPPWWMRPSEALRSLVSASSGGFDSETASLYNGLVIGDDRDQSIGQQARFRAAGLSHLLAVSGQNVAFVLLVMSPLLRRLPPVARLAGTAAVLTVFAVATRLEPSVMRATLTAGIAAWAMSFGRRSSGIQTLSLAVAGLVLIDPFLIDSVGFQLSVAASSGILLLGPSLAGRAPGPAWFAQTIGATLGAQLGVLPLLLLTFGPVSLITIPANLLAGWAAGMVMTWGMSGGLLAGAMSAGPGPDRLGDVLQWPAGMLVSWVDGVARWASLAPAPMVTPRLVAPLLASVAVLWLWGPRLGRTMRLAVVLLLSAVAVVHGTRAAPDVVLTLESGATYWPPDETHPAVLVIASGADRRLLSELLASGVRSTDLIILERGDRVTRPLLLDAIDQLSPSLVLAPADHVIRGAHALTAPASIAVAGGRLQIAIEGRRLEVTSE